MLQAETINCTLRTLSGLEVVGYIEDFDPTNSTVTLRSSTGLSYYHLQLGAVEVVSYVSED